MKFAMLLALISGCLPSKMCPPSPPTPRPPPYAGCSRATMPPLVISWLDKNPLPTPNGDEIALLVRWASSECDAQDH